GRGVTGSPQETTMDTARQTFDETVRRLRTYVVARGYGWYEPGARAARPQLRAMAERSDANGVAKLLQLLHQLERGLYVPLNALGVDFDKVPAWAALLPDLWAEVSYHRRLVLG